MKIHQYKLIGRWGRIKSPIHQCTLCGHISYLDPEDIVKLTPPEAECPKGREIGKLARIKAIWKGIDCMVRGE